MKKWKSTMNKFLIKNEDFEFVQDKVCENNRTILKILCTVFCSVFTILILLGILGVGVPRKDLPLYAITYLYVLGVSHFVRNSKKQNYKVVMIATYLIIALTIVYGLVVSYMAPGQYTVSFIVLQSLIWMTFVDKPFRMVVSQLIGVVLCIGMISVHKDECVRIDDIITVTSYTVVGLVAGCFTVNTKIHSYMMDKLHGQDIERGRQKLSEKEMEASQLLVAVKASYEMIVSVNLTQNTYQFVGDESFITRGDAQIGVFDQVLDVHASRVVEEYRQSFYDAFAREQQLKAYAEGKREIYLEYQQYDEEGVPHWLGTHTMLVLDSVTNDITNITISQNIDERVLQDLENKAILKAERDRAEQAQKAKSEFLFQMSHDIRTPMNAILGFTNFIKSSDDLGQIHTEYIPKLETAGGQLLMLINDALEMSRIESGKLVFHETEQDIRSIITNVLTVMQIQAEEKGVELVTDFNVDHPIVSFDYNHLNRVVMNLVSNAVKFTPAGGKVSVSLYEEPEAPEGYSTFELKIADTGIGMSDEFIKKAFEPFEREQTSTVSGMQGTGLGLAIVKQIVEAVGGSIVVESKQGEGSVFTLCFTLERRDEVSTERCQEEEDKMPSVEEMAEYFKGKRILLVEDNEFNLLIAQTLLENAGFCVETATDGRMAVNKVIATPTQDYYDAILMDVQMPVLNGYDATREIRGLKDGREGVKIIAITANAFDTDRRDALSAGMNEHIAKPIDVTVLYKTLWNMMR